jgi:hypothetical protein
MLRLQRHSSCGCFAVTLRQERKLSGPLRHDISMIWLERWTATRLDEPDTLRDELPGQCGGC